jgi:uncharacterized membrane protein YfcA
LLWWLAYIALGLFSGFFAGMLGIGGGLVMVPTLTLMFAAQAGFPLDRGPASGARHVDGGDPVHLAGQPA